MQYVFNDHEFSIAWGPVGITLVFKQCYINDAKNYNRIFINILAKLYSQIPLIDWLDGEMNTIICEKSKFGFQKDKSITDCICYYTE